MIPKKLKGPEYLEIEDNALVITDPISGETNYIGATGSAVLALVDGTRTAEEIAAEVSKGYGAAPEEILPGIIAFFSEMSSKSIISLS